MRARLKFHFNSCRGKTMRFNSTLSDCLQSFNTSGDCTYHRVLARWRFLTWKTPVLPKSVVVVSFSLHFQLTSVRAPFPSAPSWSRWSSSAWWGRRKCVLWSHRHWTQCSSHSERWNECWSSSASAWTSFGTKVEVLKKTKTENQKKKKIHFYKSARSFAAISWVGANVCVITHLTDCKHRDFDKKHTRKLENRLHRRRKHQLPRPDFRRSPGGFTPGPWRQRSGACRIHSRCEWMNETWHSPY